LYTLRFGSRLCFLPQAQTFWWIPQIFSVTGPVADSDFI